MCRAFADLCIPLHPAEIWHLRGISSTPTVSTHPAIVSCFHTMAATTLVTNIYTCGHCTTDHVDRFDEREYFICYNIGTCTEPACSGTDVSALVKQFSPVSLFDRVVVHVLDMHIDHLIATANSNVASLGRMGTMDVATIEAAGTSSITKVLLADNHRDALDAYFDMSLMRSLRRCINMSIDDISKRPLFDFCYVAALAFFDTASIKGDALGKTVNALRCFQRECMLLKAMRLHTPVVICFQPETSDYEQGFGSVELSVLKRAGPEGKTMLSSTVSHTAIAASTNLVALVQSHPPPATTVTSPRSSFSTIDELEAMLQALEDEMKINGTSLQSKSTTKAKRIVKRVGPKPMKIDTLKARTARQGLPSLRSRNPRANR